MELKRSSKKIIPWKGDNQPPKNNNAESTAIKIIFAFITMNIPMLGLFKTTASPLKLVTTNKFVLAQQIFLNNVIFH